MILTRVLQRMLTVLFVVLLTTTAVVAQTTDLYTFQQLSHISYAKQKDSIKKAWVCPALYNDKVTQKKYKEIYDSRTEFITNAIDAKKFVYEKDIYNYVYGIIAELAKSNPTLIPSNPILLIDRSASVNAYTIGGNIIAVNLGLIMFARNREELALVMAHELSHNILSHADRSMKEKAEWLTSDDYQQSLNKILDSKYERLTRLKKLIEGYAFSNSKHNRYHESDADSLAIVILKNSHIPFNPAFFLHLDSADIVYRKPLKQPIKNYMAAYNVPFEDWWTQKRSKGLSTKNFNFRDTTGIADSLKTHPDCKVRYANTLALSTTTGNETPVPQSIKEKANKMMIWNLFDNMALSECMYRILLEKDNGNKDEWYDFMMHNVFSGLCYSDKQLNRFNAIDIQQKEYISADYYAMQNMLEQLPKDALENYCKLFEQVPFWQKMTPEAKDLKALMHTMIFSDDASKKEKTLAAKNYLTAHSSSMYCEFAEHFTK